MRLEIPSNGMLQKVQFITAVIARPDLLILDEPFSGLDPVNVELLRDIILEMRGGGTTVIFSTHDMAVAELMCDTIFMIHRGRKVLDGTLADIQATRGSNIIRLCTEEDEATMELADIPEVVSVRMRGRFHEISFEGDAQSVLAAVAQRRRVVHFEVVRPSLQEIFVEIAGSDGLGLGA